MVTKKEKNDLSEVKLSVVRVEFTLGAIQKSLEKIETRAVTNSDAIRNIESYVNKGKGGIKAIFIMATVVGMFTAGLRIVKEFF